MSKVFVANWTALKSITNREQVGDVLNVITTCNVQCGADVITANSEDEAFGMTYRHCLSVLPMSEGWSHHYAYVREYSDEELKNRNLQRMKNES